MFRGPSRRDLVRRGGVVALAAFAVFLGLAGRFIVFPPKDPLPQQADVVLVLGPATSERTELARELVKQGKASNVLVSIPAAAREPGTSDHDRFAGCPDQAGVPMFCEYAEPHTTRGEAEMLQRHATARGWTSAIVITQTSHLERARMIVSRCFGGRITMVASEEPPSRGWPYQIAYQTAATVKAWVLHAC